MYRSPTKQCLARVRPDAQIAHIALATTAGVDFLATWNFAHLVGASAKYRLMRAIEALGFRSPVLATPEELYEELP